MLSESVDGVYKFTWGEPRQSGLGDDLESTKRSDTSLTNLQVCICEHRWLLTRDRVTESSPKWHFRTLFGLMETCDNTEVFTDFSQSLDSGFFLRNKTNKRPDNGNEWSLNNFVLRNRSWSCKDLAQWFFRLLYFIEQILAQRLNPENQPLLSDNCCGICLQFCRLAWLISPNSVFNETFKDIESWDNLTFFCVHPQIGVQNIQSTWILGQDKFMGLLVLRSEGEWSLISLPGQCRVKFWHLEKYMKL